MKYENVLERLKGMGCELLPTENFLERSESETYFVPCGCLNCGRANGIKDFEGIMYAIYPGDPREKGMDFGVATGAIDSKDVMYTIAARCKFCGHSHLFTEPESR